MYPFEETDKRLENLKPKIVFPTIYYIMPGFTLPSNNYTTWMDDWIIHNTAQILFYEVFGYFPT